MSARNWKIHAGSAVNWIKHLTNAMDIVVGADTNRLAWDRDYKTNVINILSGDCPSVNIKISRLPSFPKAMRRMMACHQMNEAHEWGVHQNDMRRAAHACVFCPKDETCMVVDQPLDIDCPNRERFEKMKFDKAA